MQLACEHCKNKLQGGRWLDGFYLSLTLSQLEPRLPVGTPEYIAPEVLTSLDSAADYGVCCDWWSLGIIAYELLFEVTPFEGKSTTHTYGNIMNFKVGGEEGACTQ